MSNDQQTDVLASSEAPKPDVAQPTAPKPPRRSLFSLLDRKPILPTGNRLHPIRGSIIALAGGFGAFSLMATEAQFRWGVPVGIVCVFVAALGILDFLGTFGDPDDRVARTTTLAALAKPLAGVLLSLLLTLALVTLAVAGRLPVLASAITIPLSFLALVVAVFQTGVALGPFATDEAGEIRPLYRRHGFWVIATGTLLYLPMLGSYSLSDPWETHYGEVAREMLARNDWISTWWAQDGWFWSKPVLDFWMQALSMGVFGVKWRPGQMLLGAEHGHTPWPEWAVRMPVFILTLLGLYFLYKGVSRVFGRRAGLIGAIVLATMPQWFLLAHQSITDMPLVASLSASMGLLILGMHTDDDKKVPVYEVQVFGGRLRVSAFHVVFTAILAAALPQILYLASRNAELVWQPGQHGFHPHLDEFRSGSGLGNCGLPGNEGCAPQKPVLLQFQPHLQALMWLGFVGAILWVNWGERRVQRLCFIAAWFFAAVATLGKGPAGFGLPILVAFTYIAATKKWSKLLTLEIVTGMLIIAAVAIPWYLAMYVRHGQPFTDRLIFHDMWKRAMTHVHDTNEGDDVSFRFYVWQLGYALFPWTGLVPAGLLWWARRRDDASGGKGDVSVFLAMWFVFAFGLFTAMLTKFHHYIFPAVPPAAMLTGILVDRMLGTGLIAKNGRTAPYLLGLGAGAALLLVGTMLLFPGWPSGFRPDSGVLAPHPRWLAIVLIVLGAAAAALSAWRFGRDADPETGEAPARVRHENLMLGGVGLAAAVAVALAGRDMTWKTESNDIVGQARLIYLFTYNYRRLWPETLEFTGTLAACTIVPIGILVLLVVERWRRHLMVLFCAVALFWAAWGVDVYLVKASPHWGQREILEAYMKYRSSPDDPMVAYQMNWKGENFYTGNKIPAFVSSGATFTSWVKAETAKGHKTIFYVTEHTRTSGLRGEAGNPKAFDLLTDKRLNNKFVLVRARYD